MLKPEIRKIVILGAGRLALNLATAIHRNGYEIAEVYNRTESRGKKLAGKVNAKYISQPELITRDADLYLLALSEAAIPAMLQRLQSGDHLVVHSSGSVNMDVLQDVSRNYGVMYPPQTFTNTALPSFRNVPLCIEANSAENLNLLKSFAEKLSDKVYFIDSDQRRILHLSAVFANNFTNFMYSISENLLKENGMDFTILEPIIKRTALNASKGNVFSKQTGPASREDRETIKKHLEMLSAHPEYKEIYDLITAKIIQRKLKS
jgi:predicted short-subunit dehydrogenase-like oxidoreductase (DUF2520 family)